MGVFSCQAVRNLSFCEQLSNTMKLSVCVDEGTMLEELQPHTLEALVQEENCRLMFGCLALHSLFCRHIVSSLVTRTHC